MLNQAKVTPVRGDGERETRFCSQTDFSTAIEELSRLNKAVTDNPGNPAVWTARGDLHCSERLGGRGKFSRGLADYDAALAIDSGYTAAWAGKGSAFFSRGRYAEAAEALTKAIESGSESAVIYLRRALCYKRTGEIKLAVIDLVCVTQGHDNDLAGRFAAQILTTLGPLGNKEREK